MLATPLGQTPLSHGQLCQVVLTASKVGRGAAQQGVGGTLLAGALRLYRDGEDNNADAELNQIEAPQGH